jgi:hypothetical protein
VLDPVFVTVSAEPVDSVRIVQELIARATTPRTWVDIRFMVNEPSAFVDMPSGLENPASVTGVVQRLFDSSRCLALPHRLGVACGGHGIGFRYRLGVFEGEPTLRLDRTIHLVVAIHSDFGHRATSDKRCRQSTRISDVVFIRVHMLPNSYKDLRMCCLWPVDTVVILIRWHLPDWECPRRRGSVTGTVSRSTIGEA